MGFAEGRELADWPEERGPKEPVSKGVNLLGTETIWTNRTTLKYRLTPSQKDIDYSRHLHVSILVLERPHDSSLPSAPLLLLLASG